MLERLHPSYASIVEFARPNVGFFALTGVVIVSGVLAFYLVSVPPGTSVYP
jgi:hypothetical protein